MFNFWGSKNKQSNSISNSFSNISTNGSSISINGKRYRGNNVEVNNGKVIIDGVVQIDDSRNLEIIVEGNAGDITSTDGDIVVLNAKSIESKNGNIVVKGYVDGDCITKNGNIQANKINGNCHTKNGNIQG